MAETSVQRGLKGFAAGLVCSLAAAGLLMGLGGFLSFVTLISEPGHTNIAPVPADAIVVLTGGDERLAQGMRLLNEGRGERLLISGVNAQIERGEIRKLIVLDAREKFDCCVDLGKSAANTLGNAKETVRWATDNNYSHIVVVTAAYHMPRSLAVMKRAAPHITWSAHAVYPADVHMDWWRWPGSAKLLVWEYMKFLAMQIQFRLEPV